MEVSWASRMRGGGGVRGGSVEGRWRCTGRGGAGVAQFPVWLGVWRVLLASGLPGKGGEGTNQSLVCPGDYSQSATGVNVSVSQIRDSRF